MFLYQGRRKLLECDAKLWGDLWADELFHRSFLFRFRVDVYVELLNTISKGHVGAKGLGQWKTYNVILWFGIMCHFRDVDAATHVLAVFGLT
jgi:hypothetical protein